AIDARLATTAQRVLVKERSRRLPCRVVANLPMRWAQALGPLRLALLAFALVVLALMPAPGVKAAFAGWAMIPTVVLPVLAPLVFLGLLLDALMSSVFLIDAVSLRRAQ